MANFLATILGNPEFPSIREVNVRSGPAITRELLFKIPLAAKAFVKGCDTDADGSTKNGKLYTWFQLDFQDGRSGWVRDDLIEVEGDGTQFGYGFVPQRQQAFKLLRTLAFVPPSTTPMTTNTGTTATNTPAPGDIPPVVTPVVAPTDTSTPAVATTTSTNKPAAAITMGRDGVNVRRGPGTAHEPVSRFAHKTRCEILDAKPEDSRASRFKWVQVRSNGVTGWVREDYLRYEGDVSGFGLAFADAYPAPILNTFWVRDWNTDPNYAAIHHGWDMGGAVGEPILAGPNGGLAIQVNRCTFCTPDRPSVLQHGLRLNDPGVLQNPAWGFGYGNYVVVRYLYDQLPASTKAELTRRNLPNYHLFTIYAHLNSIDVSQGQTVGPNQRIGTCGNTGNSEAAHLHLEIRAWNNANETSIGRMISNRMDPVVLFRR